MSEKISEESVPVQEVKPTATLSLRRFFRTVLVISLSILCIVGGILLYQLSLDDFDAIPASRMNKKTINHLSSLKRERPFVTQEKAPAFAGLAKVEPEVKVDLKPTTPIEIKANIIPVEQPAVVEQKEVQKEPEPVKEKTDDKPVSENEKPVPENDQQIEAVAAIELNPEPVAVEPAPVIEETYIALGKALHLRDQLKSGQPCMDSLKMILKSRLPNEKQRDVLTERLMPVCTATSAFQELLDLFLKNKKEALFTYYKNTSNNRFIASLKAAMTSIVDVRRLNPVKRKPKDIISLAQNALNMRDIAQSIEYIQTLPEDIQGNFREFNSLARAYLSAQEVTDELILSFEKKGK